MAIMDSETSAPGYLALLVDFLKTRDIEGPQDLAHWQRAHGFGEDAAPKAFQRAMRLRESLRALMLANNGGPLDPGPVSWVNEEIDAVGLRPSLTIEGGAMSIGWGRRGQGGELVAVVLSAVMCAMMDGSWPRMKTCASEACRYPFYDRTRNGSGRWCGAVCGTSERMRAFRKRQREE
jgi:predicted RNA-binding Zn ribbon-like protein